MVTPRPPRRRVLVVLDLAVGIVVLPFALITGLVALGQLAAFATLGEVCTDGACDAAPLTAIVIVGSAAVVFAGALALGFFVVRAISRRWAGFVPVIGLVVIIAAYWIATAAVGAWAAGANAA